MGESCAESKVSRRFMGASTFDALRNDNYRWFWIGRVASQASLQMMRVAQGWLVYELTQSALSLSWVSSARSLVMLVLSLYGGVLCDRFDKRNLIIIARAGSVLTSALLAILIATGLIQVWHIVAVSLFGGLLASFMMPAQQSIVAELVDRKTLMNAVSLTSVGMGLTGIVAAACAGYIIDTVGAQGVYWLMTAFYVVNVWALTKLPVTGGKAPCVTSSPLAEIKDVLSYLRARPVLIGLLLITLARVFFYMPYTTYMPKYSSDVLGFDASGLGWLLAAPSIGSLVASLGLASLGDLGKKGRLLVGTCVVTGASLILWSNTEWFWLVFLGLVITGAAGNAAMVANNTLLQQGSEPAYRGRVMSVYMMVWGLTPFGSIPLGALADRLGVPFVVNLMGFGLVALTVIVAVALPKLRKLD